MSGGSAGFNPIDRDHSGYSEEELWGSKDGQCGICGDERKEHDERGCRSPHCVCMQPHGMPCEDGEPVCSDQISGEAKVGATVCAWHKVDGKPFVVIPALAGHEDDPESHGCCPECRAKWRTEAGL